MRLDLSRVRTAERYDKVYDAAEFEGEQDIFRVAAPVSLGFDITKDKEQFRLVGAVKTTLEFSCSRCLEAFACPVDASFDLRYQPRTKNAGDGEKEIEEDDLSTAFYENDEIDLGLLMGEQFYLSVPMKPLCQEGCRGLCSVCGTNLNRATCSCTREWEDPRLAVLRNLKDDRHKGH